MIRLLSQTKGLKGVPTPHYYQMVEQQHLTLLDRGVTNWNNWREQNPDLEIDLIGVDLSEANLTKIDLSGVDLSEANLSGANLSEANLSGADLSNTNLSFANLTLANLSFAYLSSVDFSCANLTEADLSGAYLNQANFSFADLNKADLSFANLTEADLTETDSIEAKFSFADLSEANLSGANLNKSNFREAVLSKAILDAANLNEANFNFVNLTEANLTNTEALFTNFTGATFTGACLTNWKINAQTLLDEVICNYIYLHSKDREQNLKETRQNFAPGEFTKVFQKTRETIKLIFRDKIDIPAFIAAFKQLKLEHTEYSQLFIQALETELDGAFVVRIEVPFECNLNKIESALWQKYKRQVEVNKKQQLSQNLAKELEEKDSDRLIKILEKIVSIDERGNRFYDKEYSSEIKQNIAEAAGEIRDILQKLDDNFSTSTRVKKLGIINKAAEQIEKNIELKKKISHIFSLGASQILKNKISHPLGKILLTIMEEEW